jgi:hypothetical protein
VGGIFVAHGFLGRKRRNGNARPASHQGSIKNVKLTVAMFAVPGSLRVFTFAIVENGTSLFYWIADFKFVFSIVHEHRGAAFVNFGAYFNLFGISLLRRLDHSKIYLLCLI